MSDRLEEAREKWIAERPAYEAFGLFLTDRIRGIVAEIGIYADIYCRAKEVDSLIKKLIKKPESGLQISISWRFMTVLQ